ncbi:hypothetical protein BD410DRAFT_888260 [Rickenella mellea]|uniref:BTB domain-containing protein n=1 Tax=Rickenella mellea TaxID=50990 RepID=A0A4Y7PMK8_9AGAM|nr:hypothetical protein BD410DRAFT_888260 [Rickenella mellea]
MNDTDQTTCIPFEDRKRHPKLWFDDGNIILTTNLSIFRVHRSILAMNSSVFADMLSIPQPDTACIAFGGLPIVELSDDDEDFTHLLHFFYDHRYYYGGKITTFSIISGLLRMSTKVLCFPLTDDRMMVQGELFPPFKGQHFAVAALARETNASILLPAALCRSSCEDVDIITDGVAEDTGKIHQLSQTDLKRCLKGKCSIYASSVRFAFLLPSYLTSEKCKRDDVKGCRLIAKTKTKDYFSRDIVNIDVFGHWDPSDSWSRLVCDGCRLAAYARTDEFRRSLWAKLPSHFGLPEWGNDG